MAFTVRRFEEGDLDKIYPDADAAEIEKIVIFSKKQFPAIERRMSIAVNKEMQAFLMEIPTTRENIAPGYMFSCQEKVLLLKQEDYCLFLPLYCSEGFSNLTNPDGLIKDAFAVAGALINEEMAKKKAFAILDAKINWKNFGGKK